jgi:glycosyltransferase involved in cell wall biosynthesis
MSDQSLRPAHDAEFGVAVAWDIPLLEGYRSTFVENISKVPDINRYNGADTPQIRQIIRAQRFDAFIITGWYLKSYWQAARACFRSGTPLIIRSTANLLMPRPLWVRLAKRLLLGWLFRRCAAFLAIGKLNTDFYRRFGVEEGRIFPALYFVDNDRFAGEAALARQRRAQLRQRWGLSEKALVFIFSGKLIPKKRPLDLIEAFGRLDAQRETGLLFVGDGELRERCEAAARHVPGDRIKFAGFLNQSEMPAAYAVSDVLVMPSDYGETWGLAVNEAMACGLPAIVSDRVGCGPDLVIPGKTGFVFSCGDIEGLARHMAWFAANRNGIGPMGENARKLLKSYSIENAVDGVLGALAFLGR